MSFKPFVSSKFQAELARDAALEEAELAKVRFTEALRDHEAKQREVLKKALNQSDTRLEVIKAALLLAEKNAAEASAKIDHLEEKLAEITMKLHKVEEENKVLKGVNAKLEEESKERVAAASLKSNQALNKLAHFQEQASIDEDELKATIQLLKSQLRDALERAEKAETAALIANEAQVRLLSQTTSLEQKLRITERDLASATQQHESEMNNAINLAQNRETELKATIDDIRQAHEMQIEKATGLLNQYRSLFQRMREECQHNVEVFDSTLTQLDKRHQLLQTEAKIAREAAAVNEAERDRLHKETAEHLLQTDQLAKRVALLEHSVSTKNNQIIQLNGKQRSLIKDAKVLFKEIKCLQDQLFRCSQTNGTKLSDCGLNVSYEVQEALARIEEIAN
uniref:HMMR_C domain-containing protein n=1 Tax=Mesocestoides corti TaxID=53468 RepID=A0A5K3EU67_MESCO